MRIFILFFLSLSFGFAQNNVSGLVVNQDGKPVQNALVQAPELALQTQSNENGSFALDISSAALLTVSADSYQNYVALYFPTNDIILNLRLTQNNRKHSLIQIFLVLSLNFNRKR